MLNPSTTFATVGSGRKYINNNYISTFLISYPQLPAKGNLNNQDISWYME
jgi:hypothetical protein